MPRKKSPPKRDILPDPLFHEVDFKQAVGIAKLVNIVMKGGKKAIAENIVRDALSIALTMQRAQDRKGAGAAGKSDEMCEGRGHRRRIAKSCDVRDEKNTHAREDSLALYKAALENVSPTVEVKSKRVGGSTYQVPTPVDKDRQEALGRRALVDNALKRSEYGMPLSLGAEIFAAAQGHGGAVKARDNMLASAKANEVNAHYRW